MALGGGGCDGSGGSLVRDGGVLPVGALGLVWALRLHGHLHGLWACARCTHSGGGGRQADPEGCVVQRTGFC